MHDDDAKGKRCPVCAEPLSDISTQFIRLCTNGKCAVEWSWPLDVGQPPLMSSSRDRRPPKPRTTMSEEPVRASLERFSSEEIKSMQMFAMLILLYNGDEGMTLDEMPGNYGLTEGEFEVLMSSLEALSRSLNDAPPN